MDIHGAAPFLPHPEMKIWWPHCEALCGTLMAYEASRDPGFLMWYTKIHNWSFGHFPDRVNGEWANRLDREGKKKDDVVVALPVKMK